jgi:branched-chain amino acid transport system permease protein
MTTMTDNSVPAPRRSVDKEWLALLMLAVVLAIAPLTGVYPLFIMQALCFALGACAFNLLLGYGGLLSFGHGMFVGTASYVTAHTLKEWGGAPELGIALGVFASFIVAAVTGYISIRRQGIYFSMITLALSQLFFFFYLQAPFTHGEDGIRSVPQGLLFGVFPLSTPEVLYYFIAACFMLGFLLIYRVVNSPFGEVLKAIRENEARAISLGFEADRYKLCAYIISGTIAGFAGSLKLLVTQNASLTDVQVSASGDFVLMAIVGGLGTLFGPVVGAFVIVATQQYLADFGQWVMVMQGMIFVVCVLAFRRGIVGTALDYYNQRR